MTKKRCGRCKRRKDLGAFVYNEKKKKHGSYCKPCTAGYLRKWYQEHKQQHGKTVRVRRAERRDRARSELWKYLLLHPCVDCGESDPIVLDLDHMDKTAKRAEIGVMLMRHAAWETIQQEIEKCEVRCANCHRRKTMAACNGWRHRFKQAG